MELEYTFPFSTCEGVQTTGVAQPYSFWVNVVNCIVILFFLLQVKHDYTAPLLASILAFELFHSFSHWQHIPGNFQTYVAHALTYCINGSFLFAAYSFTGEWPKSMFLLFLLWLVGLDLFFVTSGSPLFYYVLTQSGIFLTLLLYYFTRLPSFVQQGVVPIVSVMGVILLLMLNEKYHCQIMRDFWPEFPFHIFIEMAGIVFFYLLCSRLYLL